MSDRLWGEYLRHVGVHNHIINDLPLCLTDCGASVYATNASSFQSPNYPNNYPANLRCTYMFVPYEGGYSMVVIFTDFQLEEAATNGSCVSDYLQVPLNSRGKVIENLFCCC